MNPMTSVSLKFRSVVTQPNYDSVKKSLDELIKVGIRVTVDDTLRERLLEDKKKQETVKCKLIAWRLVRGVTTPQEE